MGLVLFLTKATPGIDLKSPSCGSSQTASLIRRKWRLNVPPAWPPQAPAPRPRALSDMWQVGPLLWLGKCAMPLVEHAMFLERFLV